MAGQEFKASEKVVLKTTREGAVEQKLASGTTERISKRTEDAVLKKEIEPDILAKHKAAGLEVQTENKRVFRNLKFGRNNTDKLSDEERGDNQQSENTINSIMPVVSINFTPKEVNSDDFSRKSEKKKRSPDRKPKDIIVPSNKKAKTKKHSVITEQKTSAEYIAIACTKHEDTEHISNDIETELESNKLSEDISRNTLSEHSSFAESLSDDSNDNRLSFEESLLEKSDETVSKSDSKLTVKEKKKLQKQVNKDEKKLSKAEKKLEKAEKKLPTQKNIRFDKQFNPKKDKAQRKLRFEEEVKPVKKDGVISKSAKGITNTISQTVSGTIHSEIAKYEEENPTLKAAHGAEKVAESALHTGVSALKTANQNIKTAPYRKVSKLKFQKEQAENKLSYHKAILENPELKKNKSLTKEAMKKAQQKQNQVKNAKKAQKTATKAKEVAEKVERKVVEAISSNKIGIFIVVIFIAVFAIFSTLGVSCSSSFVENGTVYLASSYTSSDSDIYSANNQLIENENNLADYINHIPDYYIDWSEYNYYLDDIEHNPYELISYLSAMKIAFKYDEEIQDMINEVYNEMYNLEIESIHEVRSDTYIEYDDEGNEYEVTVYYDYFILNVTLTSKCVEEVVIPKLQAAGVYDLYLAMIQTKGNKPYLF